MEDARTGREVDPRQQDMELLRQVDEAVQDADADTLPGFSRKPSAPWRMEAGDEVVIADINRAIAPSGAQVTAVASFDELPQLVKEKAKAHGVGPKEMRGITLTFTWNTHCACRWLASVAVQTTSVVPAGNVAPEPSVHELLTGAVPPDTTGAAYVTAAGRAAA